jgi:hypothetical protein
VVLGPVHDAAARPGVTPGRQFLARLLHRHGFSPRINGEGRIATMPGRRPRTVRPALKALYATLSDAQKARLDSNSHRGRFWHWRDR